MTGNIDVKPPVGEAGLVVDLDTGDAVTASHELKQRLQAVEESHFGRRTDLYPFRLTVRVYDSLAMLLPLSTPLVLPPLSLL